MGRTERPIITDPVQLLVEKGRAYVSRKKYVQIMLFSNYKPELQGLVEMFGGNIYRHRSGYLWCLASRETLELLVLFLSEQKRLPSVSGFENEIIRCYMQDN